MNRPLPYIAVIPSITGSISAVASSLIIHLIFRSKKKLSTIYHRIMFGMSCADILSSVAIALSTLPLPKTNVCTGEEDYDWGVLRLGNNQTCQAQGFFTRFGLLIMFFYNGMLCCYYACAIAFRMREHVIRKRIEPILHGFPITYGLLLATMPLITGNPYEAASDSVWCTPLVSDICNVEGPFDYSRAYTVLLRNVILLAFFVIIPLTLIIWKTVKINRALSAAMMINTSQSSQNNDITRPLGSAGTAQIHQNEINEDNQSSSSISRSSNDRNNESNDDDMISNEHQQQQARPNDNNLQRILESHERTKVVVVQALAYIIALGVTVLSLVIPVAYSNTFNWAAYLQVIILPLQGFFNFLIFVGHKVFNYRRVHRNESYCTILFKFFFGDSRAVDEQILLSRLSLVRHDRNLEREQQAENGQHNIIEVSIYDEDDNEECISFMVGGGNPSSRSDIPGLAGAHDDDISIIHSTNISSNDNEQNLAEHVRQRGTSLQFYPRETSIDTGDDFSNLAYQYSSGADGENNSSLGLSGFEVSQYDESNTRTTGGMSKIAGISNGNNGSNDSKNVSSSINSITSQQQSTIGS